MQATAKITEEVKNVSIPGRIILNLTVTEPEVLSELTQYQEGEERDRFALNALRVGILAIRQAGGLLDSATLREEGEKILGSIKEQLAERSSEISSTLKQYFDPESGDFHSRLERLIRQDGELEALLKRHLNGDASTLTQTLLGNRRLQVTDFVSRYRFLRNG